MPVDKNDLESPSRLRDLRVIRAFEETMARASARWDPLSIQHDGQDSYKIDMLRERFIVNPSGRRSGKSEIGKRGLVLRAAMTDREDANFVMAAPTRDQAKRIFWNDLKRMIPEEFRAGRPNETTLTVRMNSRMNKYMPSISVVGMDRAERIEGAPLDGILATEFGNFKIDAWGEHIRPALSTIGRPGFAWLEGTPEGRNHYFDLVQEAQFSDQWCYHQWPSWELLDPEEIAAAKRQLDPLTFRQEYGGEFVEFSGRAYYGFSRDHNIDDRCLYDPEKPLHFSFDFNVKPGVAVVAQELNLNPDAEMGEKVTCIVDEVWIGDNSNTIRVCKELNRRYQSHKKPIFVYADASGGARHTSQVEGSDLDLIRAYLRGAWTKVTFRVPKANPAERARLNAVNSRLESMSGDRRMFVHPNCKRLIADFEGVALNDEGGIDKKSDPKLTHISDAIGYQISYQYSVKRRLVTTDLVL